MSETALETRVRFEGVLPDLWEVIVSGALWEGMKKLALLLRRKRPAVKLAATQTLEVRSRWCLPPIPPPVHLGGTLDIDLDMSGSLHVGNPTEKLS